MSSLKNRRRRVESVPKLPDGETQETITTMPDLSAGEQDKSLPPLPTKKNSDIVIEMNSSASRSSISLNTPIKSTPVVSTTPTNVNSLDNYSITNKDSANAETDSIPSNDEKENIQNVPDTSESGVMGSLFKNITGYGGYSENANTHQRASSLVLDDNDESLTTSTEYELGDGIKFGNQNGSQMLSYRRSRGKSSKPKSTADSLDVAGVTSGGAGHKKSNSISTSIMASNLKRDLSPIDSASATPNINLGTTPVTLATPKAEVDYNLYVDEKYLDTQYRYATEKRNEEFHQLFTNIPEVDRLLDDFSCALSREILLQGRIYISEHYLCFNSSLLGWVTTLVISLDEIQKFERRSTVGLFPNGIIIETKEAKHTFANFITRDQTLNFIETIWSKSISLSKQNHEKSRDFESIESKTSFENANENNNVKLLTEDDIYTIDGDSSSDDNEEVGDVDDEEYDTEGTNSNTVEEVTSIKSLQKSFLSIKETKKKKKDKPSNKQTNDLFPGPKTHAPSSYSVNEFNTNIVLDQEFNIPIGLLYEVFFGKDITFHKNMMIMNDGLNFTEYSNFTGEGSERSFEYDKSLNYPIGPKSTRVYCTEKLTHYDVNDYIEILNISKTPNVPSGGAFDCRTTYSIIWGHENRTRLIISFKLEWSGSSWFKSIIESSALSGQTKAANDVKEELKKIIPHKIIEFNLHENEEETKIEEEASEDEAEEAIEKKVGKTKVETFKGTPSPFESAPAVADAYFLSKQQIQTPYGDFSLSNIFIVLFILILFESFLLIKLSADNMKLSKMIQQQTIVLGGVVEKIEDTSKSSTTPFSS